MPLLSKPSSSAYASLLYITIGALTDVWSGIWYWYMHNHPPANSSAWYWCYGFLLTGFALLIIGLAIGRIGRAARHAELPPPEATAAETNIQKTAAANPPVAVPLQSTVPPVAAEAEPAIPTPATAAAPAKQPSVRT